MNIRVTSLWQPALVLVFSFLTIAGSAAAPSWSGTASEENGWPLVNNPAHPMEDDQTLMAEEMWRLGHEEDEQETIFGLIADGLVDEEGNTYLLDSHLTTIYKVAPDGEIVDNLGREGDGPGEFRNILNMIFMPDGKLGIFEMMPGRIVTMGREGQPGPRYSFGEETGSVMQNIGKMAADKNSVVIGQTIMDFDDGSLTSTNSLARYGLDGNTLHVIFSDSQEQEGGSLTLGDEDSDFARYWAMDRAGRVVVFKDKQQYNLEIYGTDGKPEMMIRRDYEPVRRTDKEIEQDKKQQKELRKRFIDMEVVPVPELARNISDAFSRPNGDLWVQNSQGDRDCPDGAIGYFDVFSQDGKYTKRICIQADYDPQRDNFRILDNHLLVFKEAQNAPERTTTSGGGGMQMVMVSGVSGNIDEDEDEEPRPYEVVFYRLP